MVSRDGQSFRRYSEAIIPPTAPEERDGNRSNYMAWGLVQLPGQHDEWSVYAKEAYYKGPGSRIRRFVYRTDGLVALSTRLGNGVSDGEAVTRPLKFSGRTLVLNYRTSGSGSVRVELQDLTGQPIAPFTADASLLRGDERAAKVSWSANSDLTQLTGKPIRVRFLLQDAELFSLRFE